MKVLRIQVITPEGRQAVQMFSDRPELILEFIESFYLEPWWASIVITQGGEEWPGVGRNGKAELPVPCRVKATAESLQRGEWWQGSSEGATCLGWLNHAGLHGSRIP